MEWEVVEADGLCVGVDVASTFQGRYTTKPKRRQHQTRCGKRCVSSRAKHLTPPDAPLQSG